MCQRCQKSCMLVERNGALKLNGKLHAEQQAKPDRDVRVSREVEQDLENEAEREPGFAVWHRAHVRLRVDRIDDAADRIAENDLLDQPDRDERDAERELALPARRINLPAELVHHLRPARERARDRLREERDVERVAVERIRAVPSPSAGRPDT